MRASGTASGGWRIIGNEHAVSYGLTGAQDAEADRAVWQLLLPEGEGLTGVHRADEFRRADAPAATRGCRFHESHHLIEQQHAGNHGRPGKMAGERRMLGSDRQGQLFHGLAHAAVADFACAASARSAERGSFPVALRGSCATNNSGRGRNTASMRSRSAASNPAASSPGATTQA